jgi:hypothetical protein
VNRALAGTAIAGLCATCLSASAPAGVGAATCGHASSPTVLENDLVRVYHDTSDEVYLVCSKRTRVEILLGDDESSPMYPPPGADLSGPFVAAAIADNGAIDPAEAEPETHIVLVDARRLVRGRNSARAVVAVVGADHARDVARVGRVVVTSNGDAAWTSCPASQAGAEADPRPNCVRPGAKDTVWTLKHGSKGSRAVARGTTIAPRSVRLKDARVSWVEDGRHRSAALR